MSKGQNQSLTGANNKKRTLNDIELICAIIQVFYQHKPLEKLTAGQIVIFLERYYTVDKERVESILKEMATTSLIGKTDVNIKNQIAKSTYDWSIRQKDEGGIYHVSDMTF